MGRTPEGREGGRGGVEGRGGDRDGGGAAEGGGAAVCVELWEPTAWLDCLQIQIPQFRELFDDLSG